jgi:hypothetical protein
MSRELSIVLWTVMVVLSALQLAFQLGWIK